MVGGLTEGENAGISVVEALSVIGTEGEIFFDVEITWISIPFLALARPFSLCAGVEIETTTFGGAAACSSSTCIGELSISGGDTLSEGKVGSD